MQNSSASGANNQEQQHLRAQLELLQSHDATSPSSPAPPGPRDPRHQPLLPASARPSNGFDHLPGPPDQHRAIAAKGEVEAHIHPDLRARGSHAPTATMMPIAPPSGHSPGASAGPSTAPIAPAPPVSLSAEDHLGDGRKAKRELSQSKRAAQNRAAQRAFRQRKEGYIKKLEQQAEHYALREYVLHLQSRLFDVSGDYPPPPPNVNLTQPPQPASAPATAAPPPHSEPAPTNSAVGTPLEAVAQAVAGLAAQEQIERQQYPTAHFKTEANTEDTRSADEINKQLQHSEEPPALEPTV
ncbi:putative transcription factor kapC [Fusarium austroafricanum]|uniref:Putative transcription factor kapC n=1 Tax=Fusarium austroafricanum TaxID=2364996 RepID=A0A8H4KHU4_9HYPO|nr:putative transcription factor kapC [Fusarium austroafricanum]